MTAVHVNRKGVASMVPAPSIRDTKITLPSHGTTVARTRITARLRYRYGDWTACATRMARPAKSTL